MSNVFLLISFLILFSSIVNSQISKGEFKKETDSLLTQKNDFTESISLLIDEIENLKILIPQTEQDVQTCFKELFTLKYGSELGQRVAYSQIWKGMTESMMKDSWGEPDKIDKSVENWGTFTQWYYGEVIFFFRDGKLIDWEEGIEGATDDSEFYLNKKK